MIGLVTDSFEITSVNDEVWTNSTGRRGRVTCSNEVRGGYRYLAPCVRGSRAAEPKIISSFSMCMRSAQRC